MQEVVDMNIVINSSTARSSDNSQLTVTFTCVVDSQPTAQIIWFFDNGIDISRISIMTDIPSTQRQVSTLTLSSVQLGDQGLWTCNATSPYGSISSSASLTIFGKTNTDICSRINTVT